MNKATFRSMFATLQRQSKGVIYTKNVPAIFSISELTARKLLSRWEKQGWLARIKRGVYLPLPLEAESAERWSEDPWIIADIMFGPCYIGGWSACEHWGLTEQIFRGVVVFTAKPIRKNQQVVLGTDFKLKKIIQKRMFGTALVWKGQIQTMVSDPARTIVDAFDDPLFSGGFRQAVSVLGAYMKSKSKDLTKLLKHMEVFGNKALFKRLGYIFEVKYPQEKNFIEACRRRMGKGYSKLDPASAPSGSFLRRWNLRLNKDIVSL